MLSAISSWLISITGIICLSVVVELVLPEGQINRYIKGIMSFLVTLIIVLPLPKLLNSKKDYSNIIDFEESISVDKDYLYQLNLDKANSLKEDIEAEISRLGYENVDVYISCDIFESQMTFSTIFVDINNLVITENAEHKDILKIKQDITLIIQKYIKLDEEAILYDG